MHSFSSLGKMISGFLLIIGIASCGSSKRAQKDLLYLQGNLDTLPNHIVSDKVLTIQKGDLLSINVYSDNMEATAIFNYQQAGSSFPASGNPGTTAPAAGGYLVDESGNIQFQTLGKIHAEGLTKEALIQLLNKKLAPYLTNPYVIIRFLNFRFTVIGEVAKPGTYIVPQEKISVLEMLGMAGDLTVFGRRDNILIIREKDGKRQFGHIDIRKPDLFQSPFFYLEQNDVVVIEANSKKATLNDQTTLRNLSIVTGLASLISTAAIIINIFRN